MSKLRYGGKSDRRQAGLWPTGEVASAPPFVKEWQLQKIAARSAELPGGRSAAG